MVDPVGDKNIIQTIVVHIKNQPGPAPIGGFNSTEIGYLRKAAVSVVQLKGVLNVLLREVFTLLQFKNVIAFKLHHRLDSFFCLGQHIGNENVVLPIVVDVGNIDSHGRKTQVGSVILDFFRKGSVFLVDVEVVPFVKVIGNVDVRIKIVVDVGYKNP